MKHKNPLISLRIQVISIMCGKAMYLRAIRLMNMQPRCLICDDKWPNDITHRWFNAACPGTERWGSEINTLLTTKWAKMLGNSFVTVGLPLMNRSNTSSVPPVSKTQVNKGAWWEMRRVRVPPHQAWLDFHPPPPATYTCSSRLCGINHTIQPATHSTI